MFYKITLRKNGKLLAIGFEESYWSYQGVMYSFKDQEWRYVGIELYDIEQNFNRAEGSPFYAYGCRDEQIDIIDEEEAYELLGYRVDTSRLIKAVNTINEAYNLDPDKYGLNYYRVLRELPPIKA